MANNKGLEINVKAAALTGAIVGLVWDLPKYLGMTGYTTAGSAATLYLASSAIIAIIEYAIMFGAISWVYNLITKKLGN